MILSWIRVRFTAKLYKCNLQISEGNRIFLKNKIIVIITVIIMLFALCLKGNMYSQDSDGIIEGEELPPRTRISILDVIFPEFTIDDENVKILDKILSGDTIVLQTISYEDYVDLLDLMNEYRYYVLTQFTPNNSLGVESRDEITRYYIYRASYQNAFISFAYALFNPDERIVINAFIHYRKLAQLIEEPDAQYIKPIRRDFIVNLDYQESDRVKAIHLKAILVLERLFFFIKLEENPELLATATKRDFRLIYARIEEGIGTPPFFLMGEDDVKYLVHGLKNPYLSIVYACLNQLRKIFDSTPDVILRNEITSAVNELEHRMEKYDLFLGEVIYELSSEFH
jgi:hypothetical protein